MSIAMILASALAAQTLAAGEVIVEVAYPEMIDGRSTAAIERIEEADARDAEHPARLINLGVAHARLGETGTARELFEAVAESGERIWLETASGDWIDARELGRDAIAMLDRGAFAETQFAAR